jgi:heme/copper-type cytochrome/quinol oxidase subunit 2
MAQLIKRHRHKIFAVGLIIALATFAMMAFTTRESPRVEQRELEVIAREIAFHSSDQPGQPNPVLRLRKGEPVKLTLRNEEISSVLHCFIITGLNVKTTRSLSVGESETLTFTPNAKGTFAYACLMHPNMSGKVVVE